MSLETRNSAQYKREEQLKRWEESDTNKEPSSPKQKSRKIKFSSGCVFLAACAAGDKNEVEKLLEKGADINTANVDGLTALHQACIDDNLDIVEFLVEHGADVNRGDNEGWTPLHATASCGFLYIAKYLIEKGANVAAVNNDGEIPLDIAECQKMEDLLKEEIEKRGIDCESARKEEENVMLRDAKEWLSKRSPAVNQPHPKTGATPLHVASAKGYIEVVKLLLQCEADIDAQDLDGWTPLHAAAHWGQKEVCQLLVEKLADMEARNCVGQTPFDLADTDMISYLENLRDKQNKEEVFMRINQAKERLPPPAKDNNIEIIGNDSELIDNNEKKNIVNKALNSPTSAPKLIEDNQIWRKPLISENDYKLPEGKRNLISNNTTKSSEENVVELPQIDTNTLQYEQTTTRNDSFPIKKTPNITNTPSTIPDKLSSVSSPQQQVTSQQPPRRSFVPPVRDEESETQRKAHAKRVRETRRSTQGVTLEEIKSAEQFAKYSKKKNQQNSQEEDLDESLGDNGASSNGMVVVTATITTGTPTVINSRENEEPMVHERRPSWRLKVDNGTSKFKLEDASKPTELTTPFIRKTNTTSVPLPRPSSLSLETADTTITIPLRRPKSSEDKDQDKENDVRSAQATLATQAAIQRRRRPKRRSTGVVSFDNVDDLDQEKDPTNRKDVDDSKNNSQIESGPDRNSRSRISSTADIRNENGEIDYKKLYEQQLIENERLKEKFKKSEEELRDTKQTLEKINVVTSKNSLSELEKRERRAMERKLSEMEEELKNMETLKSENQRLKDENGALIRVISKLSK